MEHTIEKLLVDLNSLTLKRLACANDRPDQIQFRIGGQEDPQIRFQPINETDYSLVVKDEKGYQVEYPISVSHKLFHLCQQITQKVAVLCNDNSYQELKEKEFYKSMLSNLIEIVKPVIAKDKELKKK